jgi:hypothetical protein
MSISRYNTSLLVGTGRLQFDGWEWYGYMSIITPCEGRKPGRTYIHRWSSEASDECACWWNAVI